jgi:hypothetical protein
MNKVVLDHIPFQLDLASLMERVRVKEGSSYAADLESFLNNAQSISNPKAFYMIAFIESKGDDYVVVDGVKLTSRVLRVNLDKTHRVFLFAATCGTELEDWSSSISDMLQRYWADTIKLMAVESAIGAVNEHLEERYHSGPTSMMAPGSLEDWPIQEQRSLFTILGNLIDTIGVQLLDSFLMIPTNSVAGILFPTEERFESCQLCPRENCPARRAPYDIDLYDRKYQL